MTGRKHNQLICLICGILGNFGCFFVLQPPENPKNFLARAFGARNTLDYLLARGAAKTGRFVSPCDWRILRFLRLFTFVVRIRYCDVCLLPLYSRTLWYSSMHQKTYELLFCIRVKHVERCDLKASVTLISGSFKRWYCRS